MSTRRVAVFDLDGTLLDTLQDLTNSVNFAMEKLSLPTYGSQQVQQMIGNGVSVLMRRAVTEHNLEKHSRALQLQREYYIEHGNENTTPFDGVVEMISALKECNTTVIVHTNKDEGVAKQLCQRFFGDSVDIVCGTTNDALVKPDVQKLSEVLARLGQVKAVYCGDSDVDLQTAKNANLPCVSVTWGFRSKNYLLQNGAEFLADTPAQALDVIKKLLD